MSEVTNTADSPESPQGFYASALHSEMLIEYQRALGLEGLDEEIALLRAFIKMIVLNSAVAGYHMLPEACACMDQLRKTQRKRFKDKSINTDDVVERVHRMCFDSVEPNDTIIPGPMA
jgi:hypothetical protein